ncbi:MAG: cyclic pyranopterin monophosphate synthase MoaC [Myxococcales bacterium]|nr:cyclic pyranopterin monophosphate synthase MoaC [Myxococcales bacterium]
MAKLTHTDQTGRATMVEIGEKPTTQREALAEGFVRISQEALALVRANQIQKGDVLATARIAGIMGGKETSRLIPLCHPLGLTSLNLALEVEEQGVRIRATARTTDRTGVEMEALTAVSIAALTVYDMCKAVDKAIQIDGIRLLHKSGGRSGDYHAEGT